MTANATMRDAGPTTDLTIAAEDDRARADGIEDATVDELLASVVRHIDQQRRPVATYRLQLNAGCTFQAVEAAVPYLGALGVTDLYVSPFLAARGGSAHGYDIVDHSRINPEIGTLEDLRSLRRALDARGMGLIADVVPNHMSVATSDNAWWQDVLENGPSSQFADHFDIDWEPLKPDLKDKVLLPVLGDQYGRALEEGQIRVRFDEGAFRIEYFQWSFPVAPRSYPVILTNGLDELGHRLGEASPQYCELLSILTAIRNLPVRSVREDAPRAERQREKEIIKRRLHQLVQQSPPIDEFVQGNVRIVNGLPGDPRSFDRLEALLQDQAYRLAYWRTAADEINYRRFFDINDLAAICTENPGVFEDTHALLFRLVDEGVLDGFRIDHPDGLYDPHGYLRQIQERRFRQICRRLRHDAAVAEEDSRTEAEAAWSEFESRLVRSWRTAAQIPGASLARPLFVVVEKILAHDEPLPADWPVHGTVGYEHLNSVNGLFVDPAGERALTAIASTFTGASVDFAELAYHCKRLIVRMSMASELNVLGYRLDRISERNRWTRDFTLPSLTRALQEIISCFRVYRTYVEPGLILERDRQYVESAVAEAIRRNPAMSAAAFEFVRDTLLMANPENADEEERAALMRFAGKFQQLTGPIMAKAVEDTASYRFNRLVSLNEVGGELDAFGCSIEEFHALNGQRIARHPHSFNATSTHDTKRSEDVRARISVISEVPREWQKRVRRWKRWNERLKSDAAEGAAPSCEDEYLLYQTLVGTWPHGDGRPPDSDEYVGRIREYLVKVAREAKVRTSWIEPNDSYESALRRFVDGLFGRPAGNRFLKDFGEFVRNAAVHGHWNSLAQVVLKACSPGVPDFYQGSESWLLTLVDPDNRRPVDLVGRGRTLDELLATMCDALGSNDPGSAADRWVAGEDSPGPQTPADCDRGALRLLQDLVEHREDGRIKLFVTLIALHIRRRLAPLFRQGTYTPLRTTGRFADRIVSFAVTESTQGLIVVVPRWTVNVVGLGGPCPIGHVWEDTRVEFPEGFAFDGAVNAFTRERIRPDADRFASLPVAEVLRHFPVGLLTMS